MKRITQKPRPFYPDQVSIGAWEWLTDPFSAIGDFFSNIGTEWFGRTYTTPIVHLSYTQVKQNFLNETQGKPFNLDPWLQWVNNWKGGSTNDKIKLISFIKSEWNIRDQKAKEMIWSTMFRGCKDPAYRMLRAQTAEQGGGFVKETLEQKNMRCQALYNFLHNSGGIPSTAGPSLSTHRTVRQSNLLSNLWPWSEL